MKKTREPSAPPPPLSADVLNKVEDIEQFATQVIQRCTGRFTFNHEKAIRALRTCATHVFTFQVVYYFSLPGFSAAWMNAVEDSTIKALLALLPDSAPVDLIEIALRDTLGRLRENPMALAPSEIIQKNTATETQNSTEAITPEATKSSARQAFVEPRLLEREMTRNQWAAKAGVNPSMVYDYLAGKSSPRPATRKLLAQALDVNVLELPK